MSTFSPQKTQLGKPTHVKLTHAFSFVILSIITFLLYLTIFVSTFLEQILLLILFCCSFLNDSLLVFLFDLIILTLIFFTDMIFDLVFCVLSAQSSFSIVILLMCFAGFNDVFLLFEGAHDLIRSLALVLSFF